MDVTWLESLLSLLEHGSFSRAAEAMHISQPALSRRIRALEQWAGVELVDRSTYPVSLTPAGVTLRSRAADIVFDLGAVRDELRGNRSSPRDAVRIAVSHTLATHFFADWWAGLNDRSLHCLLQPANTIECYESLLSGGCDLLLVYTDPAEPVGIDASLVDWVRVAGDRLAPYTVIREGRPVFTLPGTERDPVPVVSHGRSAFLGRATDRILASAPTQLRSVVQCDLSSALAGLVRAGVGVGWLPQLVAQPDLDAGTVAEIGGSTYAAELEIRLLRSRNRRLSETGRRVWAVAGGAALD